MIFLRHPTPDIAPGICYGQTDMDITTEGHEQIDLALKNTAKIKKIFASPAKRCQKLAEQLALRDQRALEFDPRLWEMNMGDWEGIAWKDIDPKKTENWLKDPQTNATPNGESFNDVKKRVMQFISELIENDPDHTQTAIICHASPIRVVQMAWEGLSFKQAFSQTPPYAQAIEVYPISGN